MRHEEEKNLRMSIWIVSCRISWKRVDGILLEFYVKNQQKLVRKSEVKHEIFLHIKKKMASGCEEAFLLEQENRSDLISG